MSDIPTRCHRCGGNVRLLGEVAYRVVEYACLQCGQRYYPDVAPLPPIVNLCARCGEEYEPRRAAGMIEQYCVSCWEVVKLERITKRGTCSAGHELTPTTASVRGDGFVRCRLCDREYKRSRRASSGTPA